MTEFKCLEGVFFLTEAHTCNNLLLLYGKRCLHESQGKTLRLSLVNPRKGRSRYS